MKFVAVLGLTLCLVATDGYAHETQDMAEIQLTSAHWMIAMLDRDEATLAALLTNNATADMNLANNEHFTSPPAFLSYLIQTLREFPIQRITWASAFYSPANGGVNVGPIVTTQGEGTSVLFAWRLALVKAKDGWRINHVIVDLNSVPSNLLNKPRPEQYRSFPIAVDVRDTASGRALASRVRITDANRMYWPPRGHRDDVPTGWREDVGGDVKAGDQTYAYVDPKFVVDLPVGHYRLDLSHGMEYVPRSFEFDVKESSSQRVTVSIDRWINMNSEGWYSGDTHVHFVSPHAAAKEARAEGVNVVNILTAKWGNLVTNVEDFIGMPDRVSTNTNIVYVNEEARHGYLGHTALLGLKQLVFPLSWGSLPLTGVPGGIDYPAMAALADEAHRQGGFVSWAHFPNPRGEVAVDIALNKVDSVDLLTWGDPLQRKAGQMSRVDAWYGFLNCGFRLPVAAGTDKMFNTQIIGTPRVYVEVAGALTYEHWLNGIRHGATFVTTGPMLSLKVDNKDIGATLQRARNSLVNVVAEVRSRLPIRELQIVMNGAVISALSNDHNQEKLLLRTRVQIARSSWIAARVLSDAKLPYQTVYLDRAEDIPVFAHTSPIYVDVPGSTRTSAVDAKHFMEWIDQGTEWIKTQANFSNDDERREMIMLFERARSVFADQTQ